MDYYRILILSICIIGCNSELSKTIVYEIKAEGNLEVKADKSLIHKFFVVYNPPEDTVKFKNIIDNKIKILIKKIEYKNYDMHLQFYKKTRTLDENFEPFYDNNCITGCNERTHIWDIAYNDKLASVYIKNDSCQLHMYYIFSKHNSIFNQGKKKYSSRKIIDTSECIKRYGYIPLSN